MKRTTVKLPETLDAIRHAAEQRGVPIAVVTREALEAYFKSATATPREFLAAGSGRSGADDVAERIEEILSSEFAQ
jgi:cobalamin biosynthesis protein CbiG